MGAMAIYSAASAVVGTAYQTAADFDVPFEAKRITVINEGTDTADISVDGTTTLISLPGASVLSKHTFEKQPWRKLWTKAASGTPSVRVIAEA